MPAFIPGLELSRRFFHELVRPLFVEAFPGLPYAAALLGPGSEVLGFDTAMSSDHDWGPRLFLFLREVDAAQGDAIGNLLSEHLPETFAGFPVSLPLSSGNTRYRYFLVWITSLGPHEQLSIDEIALYTFR